MNDLERRKAAKIFAEQWKDKGYEKGESQVFWIHLLQDVFEVDNVSQFIRFEDTVHIDKTTGFIDAYIDKTKVLIEQKSIDKDLRKAIKQSDGSYLNPFQQAKRYSAELPYDDRPRWIVTCNFKSFRIYDMNNPNGEPEEVLLKDLPKEYYRLQFLVDSKSDHIKKEEELSFKAGELVGELYDAFSKQYLDLENEQSQKDLNELCVRLVFCLYAEDAGLFGRRNVFHDYLAKHEDLSSMRKALIELFKILDTPQEKRDRYLEDDLNQFPYVNGGLFSNENIEIPTFTQEIRNIILSKASDDFNWSEISPTIFGAVFESTLNPETRRSGGMHYTSIENIHKVIDPLFLDELREKLNVAEAYKNEKVRNEKLLEFQNYISSLTFFDPACGSGNFLTESYLALRRLENEAISLYAKNEGQIGFELENENNLIKVSIQQFYGIEINDFAVKVAKTALWIAECQMYSETQKILSSELKIEDFLPLESYDNIYEGNALRVDWNEVLPNTKCSYIMGNPPFVGARLMNETQKNDITEIFKNFKNYGNIDYVGCWYVKSSNYMKNTKIETALVSTNSICQGEQTTILWKEIINNGININFAYRTFRWDSEASLKAHVHCIIVGFSYNNRDNKIIYDNGKVNVAKNINAYLVDAPNIFIDNSSNPICNVSKADFGSMPNDNGFLSNYTEKDVKEINSKYPESQNMFKLFVGATEFLHNKKRYCLWLNDVSPMLIKKVPPVYSAIEKVKELRINSTREATKKLADTPMLFGEIRQPDNDYLVIPCHSSEKRRYIPIGYVDKNVICSNANIIVPNANLYSFGILMSNVHNSWMRVVAGRIKSDYRYSIKVVYNNFPWPNPTKDQREKVEKTAQMILDVRAKYPDSSLADLYDELTMPADLRTAHQLNDKAVWEAYGKKWNIKFESDCVAELMKMYQELTK